MGTDPNDAPAAQQTIDFLFANGNLSNQNVLLAWESGHIKPFINALLTRYGGNPTLLPPVWPRQDYDTIWRLTFDAQGNLTVDNALCEGIDSTKLPTKAPQF